MARRIDFDLDVERFIARFPCSVPVFLRYRMACVGCEMGRFETVEEATALYGIPFEAFKAEVIRSCQKQDSRCVRRGISP